MQQVAASRGHALAKRAAVALLLAILCAAVSLALGGIAFAWAGDDAASAQAAAASLDSADYSSMTLDELNQAVEAKELQVSGLQARIDDLASRIADSQRRLDALAEQLPEKQRQAERSVSERYKVQRQYGSLLDVLLCAEDWRSFLAGVEYIAAASEAHIEELVALREEKRCLEQEKEKADSEKASLDEQLVALNAELQEAARIRDEKKRLAELVANTHLVDDGADWKVGKDAFVAEWALRLDAYLKGSPLAGQGKAFAQAAWNNHIDPRWSAAISYIESGKGQVCIRPHNAWGWGADDSDPFGHASAWVTWEQAIDTHARGLASGYGYTVSVEGAKKYCPPNWEIWYVTVVTQMNGM